MFFTYTETANIVAGSHYVFTVAAKNAVGEGSKSGGIEIIAASVPDAPSLITIKSASASHIEPQWTAPFSGGSDIRGYKVYKDGVHKTPLFLTDFDELSLEITDEILPGVEYEITVVAFNDVGDSAHSPSKLIMAASIPDAPSGISLVS
jgi:hypothetical protein